MVDEYNEHDDAQAIMALCQIGKVLGVACYDELSNTILVDAVNANPGCTFFNKRLAFFTLLRFTTSDDMEEIIFTLKETLHPSLLLLHPKIISNKSLFDLILSGPGNLPDYYKFKAMKSSMWNSNTAIELIHKSLVIKDIEGKENDTTSFQKICSLIDLDNVPIKQSLGALLSYMQATVFNLDSGKISISFLKTIPSDHFMKIDPTSFKALQIFTEETHPNVLKGQGRSKAIENSISYSITIHAK